MATTQGLSWGRGQQRRGPVIPVSQPWHLGHHTATAPLILGKSPLFPAPCSHFDLPWAIFCHGAEQLFPSWAGSGCSQQWLFPSWAHLGRQWLLPAQAHLGWSQAGALCRELAHGTLAAQNTPRRFLCTVAQCVLTRMGPCSSLLRCVYLGPLQKQNNLKQNNTKPLSPPCCGLQMAKQCQKEQETGVGLGGLCQVIPVPAHVKAERIQQWWSWRSFLVVVVVLHGLGCFLPSKLVFTYLKAILSNEKCILVCF